MKNKEELYNQNGIILIKRNPFDQELFCKNCVTEYPHFWSLELSVEDKDYEPIVIYINQDDTNKCIIKKSKTTSFELDVEKHLLQKTIFYDKKEKNPSTEIIHLPQIISSLIQEEFNKWEEHRIQCRQLNEYAEIEDVLAYDNCGTWGYKAKITFKHNHNNDLPSILQLGPIEVKCWVRHPITLQLIPGIIDNESEGSSYLPIPAFLFDHFSSKKETKIWGDKIRDIPYYDKDLFVGIIYEHTEKRKGFRIDFIYQNYPIAQLQPTSIWIERTFGPKPD